MEEAQAVAVSSSIGFGPHPRTEQRPRAAQHQALAGQEAPGSSGAISNAAASNTSNFSSMNIEAAAALTCLSSYNEIVSKLNRLWDDQLSQIHSITDEHWKNPEFPLARIKKIMRMDEEVKMISAEVPLMFSKAVEIFVTELSLRAWLHTEESKRRTVQRSDIAMAITKHDMFDFLIDIVPREEVQFKSRAQSKQGVNDQLQLLTPELLQLYLQHLAAQQQQQQQQQHLQPEMTTQQQQQQQQQLLQQLMTGGTGEWEDQGLKLLQDNMAMIQQLQQLLQLQLQMQQLQEQTEEEPSNLGFQHSLQLPAPELEPQGSSIATSVLIQPDQVLSTSTDNIHRVTINVTSDLLDPRPQTSLATTIATLSTSQPLHHLTPSHSSHLFHTTAASSISSSSPSSSSLLAASSHLEPVDHMGTLLVQPHLLPEEHTSHPHTSHPPQSSSPSSLHADTQRHLQSHLPAHISNVLVHESGRRCHNQYSIHNTPPLDGSGSSVVSMATVNPSTSLNLSSLPRPELHHIAKEGSLSCSLTPIDAALRVPPTSDGLYSSMASDVASFVSLGDEEGGGGTITTLTGSVP